MKCSNPEGDQTTHFTGCIERPNANNSFYSCKNARITFNARPNICVSFTKEGKTQIKWVVIVRRITRRWAKVNNVPSNGFLVVYLISMKWLWDPHIRKLGKNIMEMDMHRIVKKMGKNNPKNWVKIVTPKKWLTMTLNWRCYKHPPIAPPNLGVNLTSFEHHELLFRSCHKLLHQIDEH